MTNSQNPNVPDPVEAVEIDAAIFDLQLKLDTNLPWLSNSYGRCYRHYRKTENFTAYFPEIYKGINALGVPDYHRVTPDNDKQAMCFFVVGKGEQLDFAKNQYNYIRHRVGIVFSCNLDLINKPLLTTEIFTQQLIKDVRGVLTRKMSPAFYRVNVIEEVREFREVYAEFSLSEEDRYIMAPQAIFRMNIEIVYQENCPDVSYNKCQILQQNISYNEILSCLLPTLDFSDDTTFDALTAQQDIDLSARYAGSADVNAVNEDNEVLASGSFAPGGPYPLLIPNIEIQVGGNSLGVFVVKPVINMGLKVYYNRPELLNVPIYNTYDEGWLYQNGYDPAFYPVDGVLQQADMSISPDYLKYKNVFGHKFRLTGVNGGYYDFNTASYKDVNGNPSTFAAEFQTPVGASGADGYAICHLTGLGMRLERGGTVIWQTGLSDVALSSIFGFIDWKIPPISYLNQFARYDLNQPLLAPNRPPFKWSQSTAWSCTTYVQNTLQAYVLSGNNTTVGTKSSPASNRTWSRIHYLRTQYVLQ